MPRRTTPEDDFASTRRRVRLANTYLTASLREGGDLTASEMIALAQVHATLALVNATLGTRYLNPDERTP